MTEFAVFRARIMAAENTGDPAVFEELLADDAVIQTCRAAISVDRI